MRSPPEAPRGVTRSRRRRFRARKGRLALVRDRHWLVTDVAANAGQHLVALSSLEDDGFGQELQVIWEIEPQARLLHQETLPTPVAGRFDEYRRLQAFLHAVRWGAITSADSKALQAPFRSGIQIEDYQLDPVVRALDMPRVNLLVADDVGLGKTIEAGLVLQELILRHRVRRALILCPPALCLKWRIEMREKFGLDFRIIDADALHRLRRERGVGANVFRHYPRLIASFDWLKLDRPLNQQLYPFLQQHDATKYPRAFDLVIVDEVHQCAPAGDGAYATDSLRTKLLRMVAPHCEHRLFISATPHNGKESSYSALLELLDAQRFARGVRPDDKAVAQVVVRRMKRAIDEERERIGAPRRFPVRNVEALLVDYPESECRAYEKLERYLAADAASGARAEARDLIALLLKKRFFSSPAAFAQTLAHHRESLRRQGVAATSARVMRSHREEVLGEDFEQDEERDDAERRAHAEAGKAFGSVSDDRRQLLDELGHWADEASARADAKTRLLIDKLREWGDERVIIFTEYRDTQNWLYEMLVQNGFKNERIARLNGGTDPEERNRIIAEFQADPALRPLRLLLATDTASEGIDLQRHCKRLVHIEIPFNPNRLEQRNGRIDRHGQPEREVYIYHFAGRNVEVAQAGSLQGNLDGDLAFLSRVAKKIEKIRDDLGDAGIVLAREVENAMLGHSYTLDPPSSASRSRTRAALKQLERELRGRVESLRERLDSSIEELGIRPQAVYEVVRTALELAVQPGLVPVQLSDGTEAYGVQPLTRSWKFAMDGLYDEIRERDRPITFDPKVAENRDDIVYAHLGHRLVAQSMRLLRSEIWQAGESMRLARVSGALVEDALSEATAIVYARLVISARDGTRLHEEVFPSGGALGAPKGFERYGVQKLERALEARFVGPLPRHQQEEIAEAWVRLRDPLLTAVNARARERRASLERTLNERADRDERSARAAAEELVRSIEAELARVESGQAEQLSMFDVSDSEQTEQVRRDIEALRRRLQEIPTEVDRESKRLRERYDDPQLAVFPAAVLFLVPSRFREEALFIGEVRS